MKEYIKIIIYILIFVLLIFACINLYNNLTADYNMQESSNTDILQNTEVETDDKQLVINEIQNSVVSDLETENKKEKATDFTVINSNGEKVSLSDYIGKPVVVNFWATWCLPCKMELPYFDKFCKEYEGQVEFMMVNLADGFQETVDDAKTFIKENRYEFPVFFDTELSATNSYELYSIPKTIFVDKEGSLITSHIGVMNEATLKQYIENLIGE